VSEVERWSEVVAKELGITSEVDVTAILELTKDVAHGVVRPAAPIAAYLLGLVAGADPVEKAAAEATIRRLAQEWVPQEL